MSTCTAMAFFPANFMLQTARGEDDDRQPRPTSLNSILPSCNPQDFHGVASFMGKRSTMSFSGIHDVYEESNIGEDDLSDDGSQAGEKKRRLNMEQVKTLEKNFELGNKLEPERKMKLARTLGLQPRQIAIWFQNRRARWKTKQLEKDYELLKRQFEAIKAENDSLQSQNQKLHSEILALKNREPTDQLINLNKETEGSCSNRSENSSDNNKLDTISRRTPAAIDSPDLSAPPIISRTLFPSSIRPTSTTSITAGVSQQMFHNNSSSSRTDQVVLQCPKIDQSSVKEESLCNMFCGMDDQTGFWPWLEQ